jgi:hypothetical protein
MPDDALRAFVGHASEKVHETYGDKPIPRWDGGEDGNGRRTKPVWPKLAARILARTPVSLAGLYL